MHIYVGRLRVELFLPFIISHTHVLFDIAVVIYRYYATNVLSVKSTRFFFHNPRKKSLEFHQRFPHTVACAMFELLNCSMQTKATMARKNHVCYIKLPIRQAILPPPSLFCSIPFKICVYLYEAFAVYLH